MKKMDKRMALIALTIDFGGLVRPMLPSTDTSDVRAIIHYVRDCEDCDAHAGSEECQRVNENIKKEREEGSNCFLGYAEMCNALHAHAFAC
eukprot:jgi/Tetstr1/421755/TSEL_012659.t1